MLPHTLSMSALARHSFSSTDHLHPSKTPVLSRQKVDFHQTTNQDVALYTATVVTTSNLTSTSVFVKHYTSTFQTKNLEHLFHFPLSCLIYLYQSSRLLAYIGQQEVWAHEDFECHPPPERHQTYYTMIQPSKIHQFLQSVPRNDKDDTQVGQATKIHHHYYIYLYTIHGCRKQYINNNTE